MPQFDMKLEDLRDYRPELSEPADFDDFWTGTIAEARSIPIAPIFTEVDAGFTELITEDVVFPGFGGEPIRGWMLRPRHRQGPLPTVVTYIGYGGGRGLLGEWTTLPSAGFAHFVMDLRGQGAGHRTGDTPDGSLTGPHYGGFMTLGIDRPESYYYRRLFTDAVRAVEAAQAHPAVDPERIIVSGGSQGGAISLASAALSTQYLPVPPKGAIVDVPFLSHIKRATEIVDTAPYSELVHYMRTRRSNPDDIFTTLDYFDGVNFASRSTIPATYSVALLDDICPPSTVFASYNHYAGPKDITVYPYNGHEQGGPFREVEHLGFARSILEVG